MHTEFGSIACARDLAGRSTAITGAHPATHSGHLRRTRSATAPCDEYRYQLYGVQGEHANCAGNVRQVMAPYLGAVPFIPQSVNLFIRVAVHPDGRVETLSM
jgi:uncharacterized protein YcgI (DUF1989 family)